MVTFRYKDSIISTPKLEKKLKRMGLSLEDVEILPEKEVIVEKEEEIDDSITKYYFINRKTGYKHCSIYNKCPDNYEQITKNEYFKRAL